MTKYTDITRPNPIYFIIIQLVGFYGHLGGLNRVIGVERGDMGHLTCFTYRNH